MSTKLWGFMSAYVVILIIAAIVSFLLINLLFGFKLGWKLLKLCFYAALVVGASILLGRIM